MIYLSLSIFTNPTIDIILCPSYEPFYLPKGGALPSGSTANKHRSCERCELLWRNAVKVTGWWKSRPTE